VVLYYLVARLVRQLSIAKESETKLRQERERLIGQLIDDLPSFSRLGRQEMNLTIIEMDKLVKVIFEELISAENERPLEFNINNLPPAKGDRAMLRQVFINLLSNALKFSRRRERRY